MADEISCPHCNGSGVLIEPVQLYSKECKWHRCPAGCPLLTYDKTIEDCKAVYNNILNFRGHNIRR